jgi:hypothetical protein
LAPSSTNGGVTGSDWTTVQTVSTSTYSNWRNQYETYAAASIDTALVPAMDLMWLDVQYESPESAEAYAKDTVLSKLRILTAKAGYAKLIELTRAANDGLVPANDLGWAAGRVTYHGLPIDYIGALDSIDSNTAQPKYRFVNFNTIRPIFHKRRYMYPKSVDGGASQPFMAGMLRDTWHNLVITSRRQNGIVRAA